MYIIASPSFLDCPFGSSLCCSLKVLHSWIVPLGPSSLCCPLKVLPYWIVSSGPSSLCCPLQALHSWIVSSGPSLCCPLQVLHESFQVLCFVVLCRYFIPGLSLWVLHLCVVLCRYIIPGLSLWVLHLCLVLCRYIIPGLSCWVLHCCVVICRYFIQGPALARKLPTHFPITPTTLRVVSQVSAKVLGQPARKATKALSR